MRGKNALFRNRPYSRGLAGTILRFRVQNSRCRSNGNPQASSWRVIAILIPVFIWYNTLTFPVIVQHIGMVYQPRKRVSYDSLKHKYRWLTPHLYNTVKKYTIRYNTRRYVKNPVAFVLALIYAESQGTRICKSQANARGYMQIMPFHYKGPSHHLYRTDLNIRLGIKYLTKCFKIARGKSVEALKNYNAGPNCKSSKCYSWRYINKIHRRYYESVR